MGRGEGGGGGMTLRESNCGNRPDYLCRNATRPQEHLVQKLHNVTATEATGVSSAEAA